jgi:CheY-like chemotaxis protein
LIILLVDDDPEDRDLFIEVIREIDSSVRCLTAGNGEEALRLLSLDLTILPELIIIDINMPFMNGIKCLERIRQFGKLQTIPVIMYSTTIREEDRKQIERFNAECIVKPSSYQTLKSVLQTIVQGYQ